MNPLHIRSNRPNSQIPQCTRPYPTMRHSEPATGLPWARVVSDMHPNLTIHLDIGNGCFAHLNQLRHGSTVKPVYNDHLMRYFYAFWSSSMRPSATYTEIVSKSKLVPSVFIKTHYWINDAYFWLADYDFTINSFASSKFWPNITIRTTS